MNMDELIDQYLDEYEGVNPTDANNARKRRRALGYGNHTCSMVEGFRNWEWMYGMDTPIILVGTNSIAVPSDFDGPSTQTRIYREGFKDPLEYVSPGKLIELREYGAFSNHYSVFDLLLQIPYLATADTNYTMHYRRTTPRYSDNANELRIPDRYRDNVVFPGIVALGQEGKLDGRGTWGTAFKAGLGQMCARENPMQEGITMLPMRMNNW